MKKRPPLISEGRQGERSHRLNFRFDEGHRVSQEEQKSVSRRHGGDLGENVPRLQMGGHMLYYTGTEQVYLLQLGF